MLSALSTLRNTLARQPAPELLRKVHMTATCEAARKGTREKARKKKVKVEVKKVGFIPHNLRESNIKVKRENKHVDDSWKQIAKDNVYVAKYYRWRVYSFEDAVKCHRETHHPSMYNVPNAFLDVEVELNMQAEKSTRYVDNFQRMVMIPHKFEHGEERKILVFTKENELVQEARDAGATLVGGLELIKDVTNGELVLSDYQYIIAHPNILAELVALRGLMKRRFPNPRSGTLGSNLAEMIARFANGISYNAAKDDFQQDFGLVKTSIGSLNMDIKALEENLAALLKDVNQMRPKREGKFITRVLLKSPPSGEKFKIDPFLYVPEEYVKPNNRKTSEAATEEEQEEEQKLAVAN